eukprot:TRINITY_DN11461_c0_g1_i3.p1 TRINITY_DN11461_c0_g1~~TRINITY_DN11461_c0_g1_i3.p1  ORF type:complete len:1936 (+),score=506.74 TRINITY_DN11461_c0_g1_i3:44-5809(+)
MDFAKSTNQDYARLLQQANACIFGLDAQGNIVEWNERLETAIGVKKEEAVGGSFVQSYVELRDRPCVAENFNAAVAGQPTKQVHVRLCGERVHEVLVNMGPMKDAFGKIVGVIAVALEATRLNQAVSESKTNVEDLRRLVDNVNAPLFSCDADAKVTEWNAKAVKFLGFSKDQVMGMDFRVTILSKEMYQKGHEILANALRGKETIDLDCLLTSKSGDIKEVLLSATPRWGVSREVTGVIFTWQDLTASRKFCSEQEQIAGDLTRLINDANAPIFGVDLNGLVTEWNRKAAHMLGFTKQETMGKDLVQTFIQPAERTAVSEVLQKALSGDETANYELPLLSKYGERYTVLLNATTRRDAQGKITGVVGVGQDITALNRAMAESKRVADDLTRLIETANAPIFGVDTQGRVTEWNKKIAELSEYTKKDTFLRPLVENFITEEYHGPVSYVLLKALHGEETASFELPLWKDGVKKAVLLLNATIRRGPDGEVVGVICVGQDITQVNKATAEHQRIAEDLSRLVENANAPIFGVDHQGCVTEWNKRIHAILGYSREETIGTHFVQKFVQQEDQKVASELLTKALAGVEAANHELVFLSRSGERFSVLVNASTRRDADNGITGVMCIGLDITEYSQQVDEIKKQTMDAGRLIETLNAAIFCTDKDGVVSEWNARATCLLGWGKEETIGKLLAGKCVPETHREPVEAVLGAALTGQEKANFECRFLTKTGERKDILLNATTQRVSDTGEAIGVICVIQDITMIREVTSEQERIADDLSRLIESANAPIFGVDLEGRVNEWNKKAAEVLGYTKGEAKGKDLVQVFIEKESQSLVAEVLQKALNGKETANYELPMFSKFGYRYTILMNATPRRNAKGEVTGVVGVGQDITELQRVIAESKRVADDLTRLIETANAPIFGIDTAGNVTEWNAKASSLLSYSKQEAMGKSLVSSFITEEFKDSVHSVLQDALRGIETGNFEFPLFTKHGERRNILLNATTRRGPTGEVIGVIGIGQDITLIRETAKEQEGIADDLSRLVETANAPIFGVDLNGCVTEWNAKAANILGYSKQETMGVQFVQNFIQPEDRESVSQVLQRALVGQETANFELPLISKHGDSYTVLLNATTRRDAKGHVKGVVGVGQDITGLRRLMAESKNVADDLTRLIETANAPIFGVDANGRVSEWNQKTASITGFCKEEALGKDLVTRFIHVDHRESVTNIMMKALKGQESSNYELIVFTKEGDKRQILLNATTRRNANKEVIGVVGVGQDITEFKKASERAQRVADDLIRLIDTANAPIFGIDTKGMVTEWNAKATEVSGYSKAETIGRHLVHTFIHLEYRSSVSNVLEQALAGKEVANFELPLFTRDGKRREVLLNATPRRGDDGSVTGVLGVGQDITELNQQRKEALRIADDLVRIIETANAPIFGVDIRGTVTEWNQKLVELSQFTKGEAMGKSLVQNFITESMQEYVSSVLLKALNGERTGSFELPLFKGTEQKAVVLLNATARRGPNDEVIGVICVGQDITQINAMTAEQQRVADDLSRLIDNANAPIFGVDLEGRVTEWNRKAADMLGYTKEETMGKNLVQNFIQLENRATVEEILFDALQGKETANYTLPLEAKFGERYTVLLNATTRRDAQGRITGVVGVGQDITQLNAVMAASKHIADDLTRLIETANAPIFGIDTDGKVTEWNAKASSLLGFSKEDTIGMPFLANFITEEYRDAIAAVLDDALIGKETANFEFMFFTRSGERKEVLLNATTRRGPNGEVIGVIGVGQDITTIREITGEQQRVADDLQRLIDTANAPIFGVDLEGKVTEWNRKAADMLGYSKSETIGPQLRGRSLAAGNDWHGDGELRAESDGEGWHEVHRAAERHSSSRRTREDHRCGRRGSGHHRAEQRHGLREADRRRPHAADRDGECAYLRHRHQR